MKNKPDIELNKKGQCPFCKIKPLIYKRERQYFCYRCDRAYDLTGKLTNNWAWNSNNKRIRGITITN
jgi:hypothetical protein